jgi:hypothetical protein
MYGGGFAKSRRGPAGNLGAMAGYSYSFGAARQHVLGSRVAELGRLSDRLAFAGS